MVKQCTSAIMQDVCPLFANQEQAWELNFLFKDWL